MVHFVGISSPVFRGLSPQNRGTTKQCVLKIHLTFFEMKVRCYSNWVLKRILVRLKETSDHRPEISKSHENLIHG